MEYYNKVKLVFLEEQSMFLFITCCLLPCGPWETKNLFDRSVTALMSIVARHIISLKQ